MNDKLLNQLRFVLLTDEEGWRVEFDRALSSAEGLKGLTEVRAFLEEKLEGADAFYKPRMLLMIEVLAERTLAYGGDDAGMSELLSEYVRLDQDLQRMQKRMDMVRGRQLEVERQVAAMLRPGSSREFMGYRFERGKVVEVVEVVDPVLLPEELTIPAADMPAIRAWLRINGAPPRGVRLRESEGKLTVVELA